MKAAGLMTGSLQLSRFHCIVGRRLQSRVHAGSGWASIAGVTALDCLARFGRPARRGVEVPSTSWVVSLLDCLNLVDCLGLAIFGWRVARLWLDFRFPIFRYTGISSRYLDLYTQL